MNVSICVPAHNEAANIRRLLTSLLEQETQIARIVEIVVVASGCTDDTAEVAREVGRGRPGMHVHVQERRDGKVAAINAYLKMRDPRAEVTVVCSADLDPARDVLEKLACSLRDHPDVGMVGGRPVPDNDPSRLVGRMVRVLWELHHRVSLEVPKMGEIVAFRAPLVEYVSELSVVDEASIEDIIRAKGYALGYVPDAIVTNHGPESLGDYFEQRRRIARGHYWLKFAFGYEVATLDRGLVARTTLDVARARGHLRQVGARRGDRHRDRGSRGRLLGRARRRRQAPNLARPTFHQVARGPGRRDGARRPPAPALGAPKPAPDGRLPEEGRAVRKLPLLARLAGYRVAHATGRSPQLPVNLTVSVTYSCPSRCATCDIWQKKVDDLSVDEYGRIFPTLRKVPVWVTVSGGDQFVRGDLDEIVRLVTTQIEPSIVNIPMNGVITERIFQLLPKIAHHTAGRQLVLNLSVDEIGLAHDRIRGAERNFEKAPARRGPHPRTSAKIKGRTPTWCSGCTR